MTEPNPGMADSQGMTLNIVLVTYSCMKITPN